MKRKIILALCIVALAALPVMAQQYKEAPQLAADVKAGKLPPVNQRLPEKPILVKPVEEVGQYGGTWRMVAKTVSDTTMGSRLGYEPVVRWDTDGETIVPGVAERWTVSPDGKVFTFFLRKGMKWSDGMPFTTDDVMFYFNDMAANKDLNPAYPSWLTMGGEPVKVEKIDQYTFRLTFAKPYGLFIEYATQLGDWWYPKHYLKQFHPGYVDKATVDKMVADNKYSNWRAFFENRQHVGWNPDLPTIRAWQLSTPTTGSVTRMVFQRNPYYWKVDTAGNQLPYIDELAYSIVASDDVITMKVISGEIDSQMRQMSFTNYTVYKKNEAAGGYKVYNWMMGESGSAIFPNQTILGDEVMRKLMQTRDFRAALSMAINRDEVNELVYNGMAEPAWKIVLPDKAQLKDYDWAEAYTYQPAKAGKILDDLGLKWDAARKYRLRPDGKTLSITIEGYATFPTLIDSLEIVRSYWEKQGIQTTVKPVSVDVWWVRVRSAEPQANAYLMTRHNWYTYARDFIPMDWSTYWGIRYGQYYTTFGKDGEAPTGDVKRSVDLFEMIRAEPSDATRKKYGDEVLTLAGKGVWSIPIVGFYTQPVIVKNNFKNVPKTAINVYTLRSPGYTNMEQYFIKK